MSYVSVYLPQMKLSRIESYCRDHNVSKSKLFVRGAMAIINSAPVSNCQFCRRPSIGRFSVVAYDMNLGEISKEIYLCDDHLKKAKSESEVKEL